MIVLEKTVISSTEPRLTSVLWVKPIKGGGVSFYAFMNGRWESLDGVGATKLSDLEDVDMEGIEDGQILKYRNGTWENEDDDSGTPGPDTVGSEQIIDNSVEIRDLNDSVKNKIQKTYDISDESLSMDFDITP